MPSGLGRSRGGLRDLRHLGQRLLGEVDRKVLAQLAASADPKAFAGLVELAKQALA